MNHLKTLALCVLSVLYACHEIPDVSIQNTPVVSNIHSRTASEVSVLPEGSTALLNASGGLQFTNEILTFSNNTWKHDFPLVWDESVNETFITVLHPVLDEYQQSNLYTEGKLTDILIAQDTLTTGNDIELRFKHLFASLTIQINETLAQELQEIYLTVPQSIEQVDVTEGSFTTLSEPYTHIANFDENQEVHFILPPMENAVLELRIVLQNGEEYTHTLEPYSFKSSHNYTCNLIKEDQRPGIRTAEDLITFSLLINKQTYNGEKTLEDFGEEVDGITTYRLLSDITFTEEQCKEFLPIGYYESRAFQYVFDGEGHCISNLTLPDKSNYSKVQLQYSGLFGHIGTEGVIKNLHIRNAKTVSEPTCTRIGFIATVNEGTIMNCSVEHSTITNGSSEKSGFICGQLNSRGTIANCYAANDTIVSDNSYYIGGIVAYANGTILNCYTSHNHYTLGSNNKAGGIAGNSSASYLLTIANCYVYDEGTSNSFWALMEGAKNVSISNFFYHKEPLLNTGNSSNTTKSNVFLYDESFSVNEIPVSNYLNEWITLTGASEYPDIEFKQWEVDNNRPIFNF